MRYINPIIIIIIIIIIMWSTLFRTGTQWQGSSECRKQAVCVKD